MVWPPVADVDSVSAHRAMHGWFFGGIFSEVILPVRARPKSAKAPSRPAWNPDALLFSPAAMQHWDRVKVVECGDSAAFLANEKVDLYLVTEQMLADGDKLEAVPLTGTVKVKGAEKGAGHYYFVGAPDVDRQDAFYKTSLLFWLTGGDTKPLVEASRQRYVAAKARIGKGKTVNIFGTGPSLAETIGKSYAGDCNIICNSILKSRAFMSENRPAIVIGSDAHFHFSCTKYAFRFLSDLLQYMAYNPDALFFTFDKFAVFLLHKYPELTDRVLAMPAGRTEFGFDYEKDFRFFPGESVVNNFMLPLAFSLSDRVQMHGFTGRGPKDKSFWAHAGEFQYTEEMASVSGIHPAFFADRDFVDYNDTVDRQIGLRLEIAKTKGIAVRSGTTTFYKSLA
ncbi:hypothetical protein [Sphingomonas sp. MMS24-J13]|uniref:hypothetical protein n=1 Tax=Sphingomonas sp. MMS24-J13 TaxID=3238686 RepID=UPI00384F7A16